MTMPVPAGREKLAAAYAAGTLQLALYSTAPGATAGTEITGGGYARQTPAITTPASGSRALAASFSLAANASVAGWGLYDNGTLVDTGVGSASSTVAGTLNLTVTFTAN